MRNGRLIFSLHRTSNCFRPSIPPLSLSLAPFLSGPSVYDGRPSTRILLFHSLTRWQTLFFSLCPLVLLFANSLFSRFTPLSSDRSLSLFFSSSFSPFLSPLFLFSLLLFLRSWACKRSGRCPCFSRPETPTHHGSVRDDAQRWERPPHETSFNRVEKCNYNSNYNFLPINVL